MIGEGKINSSMDKKVKVRDIVVDVGLEWEGSFGVGGCIRSWI